MAGFVEAQDAEDGPDAVDAVGTAGIVGSVAAGAVSAGGSVGDGFDRARFERVGPYREDGAGVEPAGPSEAEFGNSGVVDGAGGFDDREGSCGLEYFDGFALGALLESNDCQTGQTAAQAQMQTNWASVDVDLQLRHIQAVL